MLKPQATSACRTVAYIRVSSEEQALEGLSLRAQEENIRAYAQARGLELVDVVSDPGVSGSRPLHRRDGGRQLVDAISSRKANTVVAVKLDRLFRNAGDCISVVEGWDRRGVALHLIDLGGEPVNTSSAFGRFFLLTLAGIAEMERTLVGERTRAALHSKRKRGEKLGGQPPFGFRADAGMLVPDDEEQRAIKVMEDLRSRGMSFREVAERLNASAVRARGRRWHPTTIQRVLRRSA